MFYGMDFFFKKRVSKTDFLFKEQTESPREKFKSNCLIKKQNGF